MSHLAQLVLLLALIVLSSKLAGALSLRLGQPAVFGKILLGLLLGPTFLNILHWQIGQFALFGAADGSSHLLGTVHDLAELGVLLLMFMAGLETNLKELKAVGKAAMLAALGGALLPMGSAFLAAGGFMALGLQFSVYECLFIGTVLMATSVSISAQTMMELGVLRSREGSTILGAAVIDDVLGILVLSMVIAFKPRDAALSSQPERLLDWIMQGLRDGGLSASLEPWLRILLLILLMALFFVLAFKLSRIVLKSVRRFERLPVSEGLLAGVLVAGLLMAWAAEWIGGVAAITGTYICGVLLTGSELRSEIESKLHALTYAFFVPVFFVSIGIETDARPVFAPLFSAGASREQWLMLAFAVCILCLSVAGKVLGCMWGARLAGFSARESLRVGVGMISRGEVGIIVSLVGLKAGIIDQNIFSIMVLMVLFTTLLTPPLLKAAFREKAQAEPAIDNGMDS
ncbi:cation:proton antiporter [bacterium]|nr:cation:proton antiporter [bacterium]